MTNEPLLWTELASAPAETKRVLRSLSRTVCDLLTELENLLKPSETGRQQSLETKTLQESVVKVTQLGTYLSALEWVTRNACDRPNELDAERQESLKLLAAHNRQFQRLKDVIEAHLRAFSDSSLGFPADVSALDDEQVLASTEAAIVSAISEYAPYFPLLESEPRNDNPRNPPEISQLRKRRPRSSGQPCIDLSDQMTPADPRTFAMASQNTGEHFESMEVHRNLQDRYAQVLSETVGRIRVHAEHIHATVVSDNEELNKMQQKSESNLSTIRSQNRRLHTYVQDRMRSICSQWLLLVVAALLWFIAFLAIRLG